MENLQTKSSMMNTSSNYFIDWIANSYSPSLIVYSSINAKNVIYKNNLTTAEFLRPFANFAGTNLNFSFGEKFTINMKNFKFDFYDSEKYKKFDFSKFGEVVDNLMLHPLNSPNWTLKSLSAMNSFGKSNQDFIFKKLKNFSLPWFNEYEKTFNETCNFNEFELYQQPFANIFVITTKDDTKEIENLQNKKNIPLLIQEGIYEKNIPSMILVLNDKSDESNFSNDQIFKFIEKIRKDNPKFYVLCLDINSNKEEVNLKLSNEYWSKYFHKLDFYKSENVHYKIEETIYGKYISQEEKENFKSAFLNFFNEYIKIHLQKLVIELDDEITNQKKGIKNGFFSIFKKSDKIEYVNVYNIYKLTPIEKKLYWLSLIQFYFRDYENAMDHLKILMGDLKSKSMDYYNSLLEFYTICHFICSSGQKKDVELEAPYNSFLKIKNYKLAFRCLINQIKMLEHLKRFNEIPKLLIKATGDLNLPCLTPLLLEKSSIYYLINNSHLKKFVFFQILAGMAYKNQSQELKKFTLNCLGNTFKFFNKNSPSFLRSKEFLNSNLGEICMNLEYFEGALKFFKNCILLSCHKNIDQDQALYIRHFLKSLNSHDQGKGLNYIEINEFNIPEVINSSLVVVEQQDYEIGACQLTRHNWGNFIRYTKVELIRSYINLSKNDKMIIKNLDNIVENKQNFSNFHSKRIFKANVNNKIYVKFIVKNPLNLNLSVSEIKLVCSFITDKNYSEENSENVSLIETEEKSILLEKNSSSMITLSCVPKAPGRIIIHGLEIGLYKIALFKHSFYKKDVSQLHNYRERRKSNASQSSSNSNPLIRHNIHEEVPNNTKEISFDIIDDNQDIKIIFPKGKDINLYQFEFLLLPVIIKNNSNFKIKRFCLFFDDNEIPIGKNSTQKIDNNVCLSNYIFKEIDLPKDCQQEILIPICPQKSGEFYLKILIKFEEEMKMKEIDIKRFIIKFNVHPSVNFNLNEEILFFDDKSIVFNLDINSLLENKEEFSNFKINQLYYDNNYHIDFTRDNEWRILESENHFKIYSKFKFTKEKVDKIKSKNNSNNTNNTNPFLIEKNKNLNSSILSQSTSIERFDFLSEEVSDQPQIISCLNKILSEDKMIINWSAKNKEGNYINSLFIYELNLKTPYISKNFLKTVFKNSIDVKISQNVSYDNFVLVTILLNFNKNNLEELSQISSYEIFVNDEENEFTWIGLSRFKIENNKNIENINNNENQNLILKFNLLTDKKGTIEINKFTVKINPKNQKEKPYMINNITNSITLEIV